MNIFGVLLSILLLWVNGFFFSKSSGLWHDFWFGSLLLALYVAVINLVEYHVEYSLDKSGGDMDGE